MLYWLSNLRASLSALNLLRYITVRAAGAGVTAFLLCVCFTPLMVRWCARHGVGQQVRRDVDAGGLQAFHQQKAGTPTMGGVLMLGAVTAACALWGNLTNRLLLWTLASLLGLGLIGFADDILKLRGQGAKGLPGSVKLLG